MKTVTGVIATLAGLGAIGYIVARKDGTTGHGVKVDALEPGQVLQVNLSPGSYEVNIAGEFGFDLGDVVSDGAKKVGKAFSDAGDAITHPSDSLSKAWGVLTHPADNWDGLVKTSGDVLSVALVGIPFQQTKDVADWAGDKMKDFAKSDFGNGVLNVIAGAAYMYTVFICAPVAWLIFAAPGMLKGESFDKAWLEGVTAQGVRIAKYLGAKVDVGDAAQGAADQASDQATGEAMNYISQYTGQIKEAYDMLNDPNINATLAQAGLPNVNDLSAAALAKLKGIREDAAFAALDNLKRDAGFHLKFLNADFEPRTGKQISKAQASAIAAQIRGGRKLNARDSIQRAANTLKQAYGAAVNKTGVGVKGINLGESGLKGVRGTKPVTMVRFLAVERDALGKPVRIRAITLPGAGQKAQTVRFDPRLIVKTL
jgi:hypothetical protein